MTLYQRRDLNTWEDIGEPGPLPPELVGLADESLADLSVSIPAAAKELGYEGHAFIPVATPAPPAKREITAAAFLQRLTREERIAVRSTADPVLEDYLDLLRFSPVVDLDSEAVRQGIAYLVAKGLITAQRAAEILA